MLKFALRYFLYAIAFVFILSIRSTFTEILSCSFIPDPLIVISLLLFDIDIKEYFKYLIILVLSLIYTQFSIGNIVFYFSSFSLLYFVYQKIMKTLNREDKLSVLITILVSLFIYNLYINIIFLFISNSFKFNYSLFLCDFTVNLLFTYFILIYLGLKLRKQND